MTSSDEAIKRVRDSFANLADQARACLAEGMSVDEIARELDLDAADVQLLVDDTSRD